MISGFKSAIFRPEKEHDLAMSDVKAPSYVCEIEVMGGSLGVGRWLTFPLRFPTSEECYKFGNSLFEPSETVTSWYVRAHTFRPNFTFQEGVLTRL